MGLVTYRGFIIRGSLAPNASVIDKGRQFEYIPGD